MKRLIFITLLLISQPAYAATRLDDEGIQKGFVNVLDCVGSGVTCSASGITGTLTIPGATGDITSVGDVTTGAAFDGTQGTTLTFYNAGGNATESYNGQIFAVSTSLSATGSVTSTTQLLGPAGSAAAVPAFSFTGDTDTGMRQPGANQLSFMVGGTTGLYVNSSSVRFPTGYSLANTGTGNPFATFVDTNAVVSSATNRLNITNGATTVSPILGVTGTDTNIDLTLAAQGAGIVRVTGALTASGAITGSNLSGTNTGDAGTVNAATGGQIAFYPTTGTSVSGTATTGLGNVVMRSSPD